MSNPNTITIYSPEGDSFEMSRVNARDLATHRGWTYSPPGTAPAATEEVETEVETEVEDEADDAASEGSDEASDEAVEEAEAGEAEATEGDEAEVTDTADAPFTTEEQFAALTERDDVVAYLAANFPDFKPHHKSSRDGLVAKAIELAAGE